MTDRDLAGCALSDVLALLEKATPGEWAAYERGDYGLGPEGSVEGDDGDDVECKVRPAYDESTIRGEVMWRDAAAIAAAVNFLRKHGPELLSRAPRRDAERPTEKGPYRALNAGGKVVVESEDFTHDVWLYVTGDFGSDGQHMSYAEWIADTLNAAIAASQQEGMG